MKEKNLIRFCCVSCSLEFVWSDERASKMKDCGCLKPLSYKLLNEIIISASRLACYSFKYKDINLYKEL